MKKLNLLLLLLFVSFGLIACGNDNVDNPNGDVEIDYLDIYYLNDLHGAILETEGNIGLAKIANLIVTEKEANPENVVVLAGGDMLQGSALSNYYFGESTINILNEMYFDAFVLGNHEFDWGLETVTNYFDGNIENGEADFPLLGANVFFEDTTTIPDGIDPYTIIERGGIKIGIIGTMGFGLESSIAVSKIDGYEFASPVAIIEDLATELRTEQDVDLVFVLSHDTGVINSEVASLTGDAKIDAIFNGHSHNIYHQDNLGIPVLQSGSTGSFVGHIRLTLDGGNVSSFTIENIGGNDDVLLNTPNQAVQDLIDTYTAETDVLFNTPIITNEFDLTRGDLTLWISKLMRINTGADIAFHNSGGTRASIYANDVINMALLYSVWPFDNYIKTVELTGSQINSFMNSSDGSYYNTLIDDFDNDTLYLVATNDYVFDKDYNPFVDGVNPVNTYLFFRDIAAQELELQNNVYDTFRLTNEIQSGILTD